MPDLTITMYGKPHCPPCEMTKKLLDRRGVTYTPINLPEDPPAVDRVKELGYFQAPVILVENADGQIIDHWSGFKPDKLMALPAAPEPAHPARHVEQPHGPTTHGAAPDHTPSL